jgi:hypothetical protein
VTDQLLRFANILAWATLVFVVLRIIVLVGATVAEPYTNDATMQRRAGFLVRNTLLLFVAAAWLCAGRFA